MLLNKLNHNNIYKNKNLIPLDKKIDKKISLHLYNFAKRLRIIEETLAKEYHPANQMRCPVHFCIGQEAIPATLNLLLKKEDYLFSHHRSHGYYLSKKSPLKELVAELYGKSSGANGGLAGSQDISYVKNNFFSGAILAGAIGISVGCANVQKLGNAKDITVVGFGESACDVGLFWESINYAFLKKLPILFICENNNYSVFSPQNKRQAGSEIFEKVGRFGKHSEKIFGNNICNLYKKINGIIKDIRKNSHPFFLEVITYRFSAHYGPDEDIDVGYRTKKEFEFWKNFCPIKLLEQKLLKEKIISKNYIAIYSKEINTEINKAIFFAKQSNFSKKFNFSFLNNNKFINSKISTVNSNMMVSSFSKKKIIGY
jgi:TPP-dependent pyruvate/acetoin dehydrogenase alpha subunit